MKTFTKVVLKGDITQEQYDEWQREIVVVEAVAMLSFNEIDLGYDKT